MTPREQARIRIALGRYGVVNLVGDWPPIHLHEPFHAEPLARNARDSRPAQLNGPTPEIVAAQQQEV
jgi:hypothetical protein